MWHRLTLVASELNLAKTLTSGQSFRWKHINNNWTCVIDNFWVSLKQDKVIPDDGCTDDKSTINAGGVSYMIHCKTPQAEAHRKLVQYFQLEVVLDDLWTRWRKDEHFRKISVGYEGLRVLRQPCVENILSFIWFVDLLISSSSNNNISRISGMVGNLCIKYGELIGTVKDEETDLDVEFWNFPKLEMMAKDKDLEKVLRDMGFGYRAKYIAGSVAILSKKHESYFDELRLMSYDECRSELMLLPGGELQTNPSRSESS